MKLLFAEDDKDISKAVTTLLERNSYTVEPVYNGVDALDYATDGDYDAIVMDIMMPRMDGITALQKMREAGVTTPVLLLTAKTEVDDRIEGLDAGADDYLTKPFDGGELLARLRAMLRRKGEYQSDQLTYKDLILDRGSYVLACGNKNVKLSGKAYQMMELLMRSPNQIFSVNHMMEHIWGWDAEAEINVVWVNISFLRKKLTEIGSSVEIHATRGAGYSLE
ncbi:MAG: response regulator transcription factor [Lachnospiraceae bacterium]|jgi:DNA-binding response OmpR family regulator|nr:response regulator transcription factor [Lachnospiraceae bacterium]